jgi:hypothetical protein
MAGLVPAIHVLLTWEKEGVDARHKAGHDVDRLSLGRLAYVPCNDITRLSDYAAAALPFGCTSAV